MCALFAVANAGFLGLLGGGGGGGGGPSLKAGISLSGNGEGGAVLAVFLGLKRTLCRAI